MRIAVTGGAGRLGQAVLDLAAARGYTVVDIELPGRRRAQQDQRSGAVRRAVDVRIYQQLHAAVEGCDSLIHLAAHLRPGDAPDHVVHNDNVTGSFHALSVAAGTGIGRVLRPPTGAGSSGRAAGLG